MKRLLVLIILAAVSFTVSASGMHRNRTDSRLLEPQNTEDSGGTDFIGAQETPENTDTPPEPEPEPESEPEPEPEPETSAAPIEVQIYSEQTGKTVVNSFAELKAALEGDNGIETIYFGADIIMTGGIRINPKKQHVIISGQDPQDTQQRHTLTDLSSLSFYSTIYSDAAGTSSVTVRDLDIIGKNYYGPIGIYDAAAFSDLELIYERVNYNGPQLVYHRRGTVRIIDCTAKIHGGNGGSPMQEFAESRHLIFEGTNTIDTETTLQPVFRHPMGGILQIADDSSLTLSSTNTSTSYGVLSTDLTIYDLEIQIGERAEFNAEITGVMSTDAFTILSGMTINEGGVFSLTTTKSASAAVLRIVGSLTVLKEGQFIIDGYGGASYPAVKHEGKIFVDKDALFHIKAQNAYSALIDLVGGGELECSDSASVLLKNAGRVIIAEGAPGRVLIKARQINYWNAVVEGGIDDEPLYRWEKADGGVFEITGTLATGTGGNFTGVTSNHEPGDFSETPPDSVSFSMINARVLAFGKLPLSVIEPGIHSSAISGITEAGAVLRAEFNQEGADYVTGEVQADESGVFHIPAGTALLEGTEITVKSNLNYLTVSRTAVVRAAGKLEFYVPEDLEFYITEIPSRVKLVKRLHHGWGIVVSDERETGGFTVFAKLEAELTPDNAGCPVLEGAVIYVGQDGAETVLEPGEVLQIAEKSGLEGESGTYFTNWGEDFGILLKIKPGSVYADTVYTAQISWILVDAP